MSRQILNINRIPSPTYRWLKMNYTQAEAFSGIVCDARIEAPLDCKIEEKEYIRSDIQTGSGEELDGVFLAADVNKKVITVPEGYRGEAPVRIDMSVSGEENLLLPVEIAAGADSDAVVIVRISSDDDKYSRQAFQIRLDIGDNARITLVTVCAGKEREIFCDVGARVSEGADFNLIQLFLSGKRIYSGCRCALSGDRSSMKTDIAYLTAGSSSLDMNYVADHTGRRTTSEINVSGVLKDKAKKLFRGTIDFKKGAKGATGNEQEDVLLLDEETVNRTIPVILCAEEDVEGNHGATIGKLPEELLFYMNSRGIDTDTIYDMMARARIDSVCRLIMDEPTEEYIRGLDIFGGGNK